MTIDDIRALVATQEGGSIAAAAERLHLTQPAVTRRIQHLEEQLGVELLDRRSKPARLTPAGQMAYRRGLGILRAADGFARGLSHSGEPEGALRLGVSYALADCVLAPAISTLAAAFPKLAPCIVTERTRTLIKQVKSGELDAAAVMGTSADFSGYGLHARACGIETVRVVAPKAWHLAGARRLGQLADRPWVMNPEGCGFRHAIESSLGGPDKLKVLAEIWGYALQLNLAAEGVALALVPTKVVAGHPDRGALDILTLDDFEASLDVTVMQAGPLGALDRAIKRFCDSITTTLARERATGEASAAAISA